MREPARTEHAAQQRYTRVIQRSLGCITKSQWYVGPSPTGDDTKALLTNPRTIRLRRTDGGPDLQLEAQQVFKLIPDPRFPGEFKASTLAYVYSVQFREPPPDANREVIAWHWHPLTTPDRPAPHLHVNADSPTLGATLSKLHVPSGRVAFEEVVRFLVTDLAVIPERPDDWQAVVDESELRFRTYRSWG